MVNFGMNLASILGLVQILESFLLFAVFIARIKIPPGSKNDPSLVFRLVFRIPVLMILPFCLFLSGFILIFQGWRLDPLLQFQQFLTVIVVGYLIFLDWKRSFK